MGYGEVWRVLDDLIVELREKGETIPPNVMIDLQSAKTLIMVFRAGPTHVENIPQIQTYLGSVESHLLLVAEERFGTEFAKKWMERLSQARKEIEETEEDVSRFVPGLPRGKHWMRIKISRATPLKEIEKLAKVKGLSCRMREDGYALVYGDTNSMKSFVKSLRKTQTYSKSRRVRAKAGRKVMEETKR